MTIVKGPGHTVAIFLDVEKAFDSFHHETFTKKLHDLGLNPRHSQNNRLPERKKNALSKLANANNMPSTPEQEYPKEV